MIFFLAPEKGNGPRELRGAGGSCSFSSRPSEKISIVNRETVFLWYNTSLASWSTAQVTARGLQPVHTSGLVTLKRLCHSFIHFSEHIQAEKSKDWFSTKIYLGASLEDYRHGARGRFSASIAPKPTKSAGRGVQRQPELLGQKEILPFLRQ